MRHVSVVVASLVIAAACSSGPDADNDAGTDASANGDTFVAQDTSTQPPYDGALGTCLGASLLSSVGKTHLLAGAAMADATAKSTPFDLRYTYISGGIFDGTAPCASCATGCTAKGVTCKNGGPGCSWWGCWQYDQDPPGAYARGFFSTAQGNGQIPMLSYYQLLQASGVAEGAAEVTQAPNDAAFMTRYFADWRFLLQQIGSAIVFLHIEPDFWGYAQQSNNDPHALTASVATSNATDCASEENSIAGFGRCLVSMVRKYAPNARVGLHASAWSTKIDVATNKSTSLDIAGEAKKTATYLLACGADISDFVVVEASDRDAGYYTSIGQNVWWDATNATLPNFHQDFAWLTALAEATNKPLLDWQLPVGNMSLPNKTNAWQDNRVDYFFAHTSELASAHVIGFAFGAGAGDQTTPESDNGNLIARATAYSKSGGQKLCP